MQPLIPLLSPVAAAQANANRNNSLWRSSLILAIVSCYLMWAITFLAQLYPLIAPKRSDLREEYLE